MTTPPPSPIPLLPAQPLPEDVPRQLAAAKLAWVKLRRMCTFASVDAWTLAILGALSLICGGYGSVSGLFVSAVLIFTAYREFRGVARLRRLDPAAPIYLSQNQLILAAGLIIYAGWNILLVDRGGGMLPALKSQMSELGADLDQQGSDLAPVVLKAMYFLLIVFAIFVQGGTALYYKSRQKHLQSYLAKTPPWIQQMQRENGVS